MNDRLFLAIIQTISFFDIFSFPLTKEELYRYLWQYPEHISYTAFVQQLAEVLRTTNTIETHGGYYFLTGKKQDICIRERRVWFVEERIKKAKNAVKTLRWIPFLRGVFICNMLQVTAQKDSDIDVFIVVKKHRLWITRLLITITLHLFRFRRHGNCVANRLCLSFYCTDDVLDLSQIAIQAPDIYLAYWLATLLPIYTDNTIQTEIAQQNNWLNEYFSPKRTPTASQNTTTQTARFSYRVNTFFTIAWKGAYGNIIEKQAKELQKKKMDMLSQQPEQGSVRDVRISDAMLKFHENDRRAHFCAVWQKKWQALRTTK